MTAIISNGIKIEKFKNQIELTPNITIPEE
jgi:hypothetical protein